MSHRFTPHNQNFECPNCKTDGIQSDTEILFFGECPQCNYVFCTNCYDDYHGHSECEVVPKLYQNLPFETDGAVGLENLSLRPAGTFECQICFEDKPMRSAADLGCSHTHCLPCVKSYYETLIRDSTTQKFKCPSGERCDVVITISIIKKIVDPQLFDRYDGLLLDQALQHFPEIINCPKPNCGRRFVLNPDLLFGYCEACDYRFCTNCMKAYHGIAVCDDLTEEQRVARIKRHLAADEAEKERLERMERERYRKQMADNDRLIKRLCKKCPGCAVNIEKRDGCNHMRCTKCDSHFCWLCLQIVDPNALNLHFQTCRFLDNIPDSD